MLIALLKFPLFSLILLQLTARSWQQQTSSSRMKKEVSVPMNLLEPYVGRRFTVRSLLECTAKGQVVEGNFVLMTSNECIMGTITEPIVVSSIISPGNPTFWLDTRSSDMVVVRDFIHVSSRLQLGSILANSVYFIHEEMTSDNMCAAKCTGINRNVCDYFVRFGTDCYVGTFSIRGSPSDPMPSEIGSINIAKESLIALLEEEEQATQRPMKAPFDSYNKFLYSSPPIDGNNASLECQALCIIDDVTPCHFAVLDDNDQGCHLGSFLVLDQDIQAVSSSIVMLMNRVNAIIETVDSVNHFPFLGTTSHRFDVPPANSTEECFVHCMLNNQLCDFSLFWDPLNCYFGSLESIQDTFLVLSQIEGTQPAILSPARMAAKFEILANALYMRVWVTNLAWSVRVTEYFGLVDESLCLVLCHLRYRCDFFVMVHDTCYLGNTDVVRGAEVLNHFPEPANEPRIIYYFFKGRDQSNYRQSPVPDWRRRIYRSVDMSVATAEPNFDPQFYCEALCALDLALCYIYVVDIMGQTCHLGAYHVDTGKPGGFATDTVFTKMSNMMVTHGGRFMNDNNDLSRSHEFGHVITEGKKQCGHTGLIGGPPGFSGTQQPKDHSMAYAHPFLVMCAETTTPFINYACHKMDMTADVRYWQRIPDPPVNRNMHVMLGHDNYVYMIGGRDYQSPLCGNLRGIDRFNVLNDIWEESVATLPKGAAAFCAVKSEATQKFFMFLGGSSCLTTVGGNRPVLRIYDPSTGSWEKGPGVLSSDEGRAGMACGLYYTPQNEEHFVVMSGVTADPFGSQIYGVHSINTATADRWESYPDLPLDVAAEFRSPEGLISLTRRDVVFVTKDNRIMHMDFPDRTFSTSPFDIYLEPRISAAQVSLPLNIMPTCIPMTAVWTMVVFHDSHMGSFIQSVKEPTFHGRIDVRGLSLIDKLRCADGTYHFRLVWPRLGHMNEWVQSSSPLEASIANYAPIAVRFSRDFGGLCRGPTTGDYRSLMVGLPGGFSYAVGAAQALPGNLNQFFGPSGDFGIIRVNYVHLYIKNQC